MARTPEAHALTEAHRQLQVRVNAATLRDLLTLWQLVDPANLRGTVDPFTRAALRAVVNGRRASSAAAQRYYVAFRQAEAVEGTIVVTPAPPLPTAVVTGAVRGAGLAGIMRGYQRGLNPEQAHANGFVKLAGAATQLVVGGGRKTLIDAIHSDPAAHGWQRVTDGSPCAFCAMVASRGIVYKGEATASFEAHGHCTCTAEPAFEGSPVLPANERFKAAWNEATVGLSGPDALNAFRRTLTSPAPEQ